MKFFVLFFVFLSTTITGCASHSPRYNNASSQSKQMTSPAIITRTLPDGKVVTGKPIKISGALNNVWTGSYYIGGRNKANKVDGEGVTFNATKTNLLNPSFDQPLSTIVVGQYKNGTPTGIHKAFNVVNGIVQYYVYENGKATKSYGELDVLLASGDFETAYKIRGNKVFVGAHLQKKKAVRGISVIKVVYNSPSDIGGLKIGDNILSINGISTSRDNVDQVLKKLIKLPFGKKAQFKISRQGELINIGFVPGIIPENFAGTKSTKLLLWKKTKKNDSTYAYQKYLNTITDKTYHPQARAALKKVLARETSALKKQKPHGLAGIITFCKQYPNSVLLGKEIPTLYKKIEGRKNFITQYSKITNECLTAEKYQPSYYQLLNIGPTGMQVKDALLLTSSGTGAELIATKIKYSNEEYKDFKFDELAQLKKFGLDDSIVSAMLESTYKKAQKTAAEYKQRAEQLAAENLRMKNMAGRQQQASLRTTSKTNEKSMPLECLKLVAALKVCDQSSGFLSMGCKAIARSSTDCPLSL